MEKFDELRKNWIEELKTFKSLSTQTLYFLLEPDDDSKFFDIVDSFKECIKETQFQDFQMLAIEYLLEYKKQNKLKIKTVPYKLPNTDTWPYTPLYNGPIEKAIKSNTIPGQPIVTYSTHPNITYTQDSTSISQDRSAFRCIDCEFFDGHDVCCHNENFGTIIRQSLDNCVKNNLRREKLKQ